MIAEKFLADNTAEVGLNPDKVQALMDRAERDVKEGVLPACQVAIARNGKIAAMKTFGHAMQGGAERPATDETVFVAMSATKAITSSALWLLIQEGKVDPADKIVKYVPEYGTNGKESTTIEHLLIHTAGIPTAPGSFKDWGDRKRRLERFAQWRPVNTPGEKFFYHIHANYWPIAEAIERITGMRLGEFVRTRIAEPLGLPDLRIGLPRPIQARMADVKWVGEPAKDEEYQKLGITPPRAGLGSITEDAVLEMNEPELREMDFPAGGLMTTAGDIALFYQALLNDGKAHVRGFGRTNSADAFGHPGFGGQIGWADPATGISFGYLTNGFDRNDLREGRRGVAVCSLAGSCAESANA